MRRSKMTSPPVNLVPVRLSDRTQVSGFRPAASPKHGQALEAEVATRWRKAVRSLGACTQWPARRTAGAVAALKERDDALNIVTARPGSVLEARVKTTKVAQASEAHVMCDARHHRRGRKGNAISQQARQSPSRRENAKRAVLPRPGLPRSSRYASTRRPHRATGVTR